MESWSACGSGVQPSWTATRATHSRPVWFQQAVTKRPRPIRGVFEPGDAWLRTGDLVRVDRARTEDQPGETSTDLLARSLESIIGRYPDQWFNFYDFWEGTGNGHGKSDHA